MEELFKARKEKLNLFKSIRPEGIITTDKDSILS